jgi:hypothetical protein
MEWAALDLNPPYFVRFKLRMLAHPARRSREKRCASSRFEGIIAGSSRAGAMEWAALDLNPPYFVRFKLRMLAHPARRSQEKRCASSRFEGIIAGSSRAGAMEWPHLDLNQGPTGYEKVDWGALFLSQALRYQAVTPSPEPELYLTVTKP